MYGAASVSYTHLDVYKRQDIDIDNRIIGISVETDKDQLKPIIKYYDENVERFSEKEQLVFQNFFLQTLPHKDYGVAPVSYTHLNNILDFVTPRAIAPRTYS